MPSILSSRVVLAAGVAIAVASVGDPGSALAQSGPTYGTDRGTCDRSAIQEVFSTSRGNIIGSLGGAALGGLIGSKFGSGSGKGALTALGVVGGALAGGYVGRQMDPADHACVSRSLEHAKTGQTVSWRNPDTGTQYGVTPTDSFQGPNGEPCRRYTTQSTVNGQVRQVDGAACRAPDGSWRPMAGGPGGGAAASAGADTVIKAQQRLHDLGFYVRDNIDGRWGPKTSAAVQNFQRAQGLQATGQLDETTLAALGVTTPAPADQPVAAGSPPPPPPPAPASGQPPAR
jgi:surface antigen